MTGDKASFTRTDYSIAILVGFFTGIFLIPTLARLGIRDYAILLGLPWVGAASFPLWLWALGYFSRRIRVFSSIAKYSIVGFLNAAIDFGVLNLLSAATGATQGFFAAGVNMPGFLLAAIHSYFWNRYWVFQKEGGRRFFSGFILFFGITVAGALINGGIVGVITTFSPPSRLNAAGWLNVAKVLAASIQILWNFGWYRFFVFRTL